MAEAVTMFNLNKLTGRVEYVLSRNKAARNSDIVLYAALCNAFYPPFEQPIKDWNDYVSVMRNLPTMDHVARARRKVIEMNEYKKYLPTDQAVASARNINEETWKEYARQNNIKPVKPVQDPFNNIPEDHKDRELRGEL